VLDERILQPLGMIDTGFFVSIEGRRRAATMYRLDDNDRLQHNVMGQPHISPPAFCNAGGGLWSTADDYLRFIEMLLRDGTLNGVRVLSPESTCSMRTDRLTDEHKRRAFLGAPFWIGRGFGLNLSVVTDPVKSSPLFGPGGYRDLQLARCIWNVVAGRSGRGPYSAVPDSESSCVVVGRCRGGCRQHFACEAASGATEIRAPHLSRTQSLGLAPIVHSRNSLLCMLSRRSDFHMFRSMSEHHLEEVLAASGSLRARS
jgi:CubicO group peptidase (beta-lactamase class C family)